MRLAAIFTGAFLLAAGCAWCQGDPRDQLLGSWQAQDAKDQETWSFEDVHGDMKIKRSMNGATVFEATCNTMGRECQAKDGGKTAKFSLWFNGGTLVLMETRGSDVWKRRFEATPDGTLTLETIAINPPSKAESVHYRRLDVAAQTHR